MPFTFGVFTLAALALAGVPPLCGFLSKWNLLTAAAEAGGQAAALGVGSLILSAVLTAAYILSIVLSVWFLPLGPDASALVDKNLDPSWLMKLPLLVLCAAMILLGLFGADVTRLLSGVAAGLL